MFYCILKFKLLKGHLNLLSERFGISLACVPGHSNVPANCSSYKLAEAGASFKLAITRKFFRNANLSSFNEESCFTSRFTWPLMDRRYTNQLPGLDCDIISNTAAMFTGHCLVGRHAERMRLRFNNYCCGYRIAEKEGTVIHFFCQ